MLINSPDLVATNVFRTAATLLRVSPGRMEDVTVVLIPRLDEGFYLLADQYTPGAMGKGTASIFWIIRAGTRRGLCIRSLIARVRLIRATDGVRIVLGRAHRSATDGALVWRDC